MKRVLQIIALIAVVLAMQNSIGEAAACPNCPKTLTYNGQPCPESCMTCPELGALHGQPCPEFDYQIQIEDCGHCACNDYTGSLRWVCLMLE